MKESVARHMYEQRRQRRILRFEERARECTQVAMANPKEEPKRKQHARKGFVLRRGVYKGVESLEYDPNPSDLGMGRLKRLERGVEDRKRY